MATSSDQPAYEARLPELMMSIRSILRRRWRMLALVSAVVFGLGIAVILMIRPSYVAITQLRIDPSRNPLQSVQTAQQAAQGSLGSELIETESSVIASPELAREVVRRLKLDQDSEFTAGIDFSKLPDAEDRLNAVAGRVLRKLDVGREKLTYIIDISFKSHDPNTAARVANTFAETYIQTRVGSRINTATSQAQFFRNRLDAMAREVREADGKVAQFRSENGIVQASANGTSGATITDQQVAPLSTQLATADSDAAEARSALAVARRQIAQGGIDAIGAVRSSPVIADLRRQRAEIERNRDEITARYGDKHPESIKVRQQLAGIDAQIQAEARRTVGSLEANATATEARAASLRGALHGLEAQQARNTRASVMADSLQRDADAKRSTFDRMSQLSLESTQAERNSIAQAEIVDHALPPLNPAAPNRLMLEALALVVGLAAGLATIIIQEMMLSGLRSIEDVEGRLRLPVLAAIPAIKLRGHGAAASPASLVVRDATSMYAETLRMIRTSLLGATTARGGLVQVVAITSAVPGEGKTTTALSLARILAMSGARTLLIDCDLRRAQLRELIRPSDGPGTAEYLRGEATFDAAVRQDEVDNLDIMAVRQPYFSAEDLFGDGRMAALLDHARETYQHVLLDLPPVMGVADARTLAQQVDFVALAIKWGATPTRAVEHALSALHTDRSPVGGAIYTMVDPSSEAIGTLYYASSYASLYTTS